MTTARTVVIIVFAALLLMLALSPPAEAAPAPVVIDEPAPPALDGCLTPSALLDGARPDAFHVMPLPSGVMVMTLWSKVEPSWLTVLFSPKGCAFHSFETPIETPTRKEPR